MLKGVTDGETRTALLDEFCNTLNGGLFSHLYLPEDKNSPDYDLFSKTVVTILGSDEKSNELSAAQKTALENAKKYLRRRALLRTESGRIGLGPEVALSGDQIIILLGGRGAFLMRPMKTGHFQMVGECYFHGFMYGEALLGPLPPHTRSMSRYDERTDTYWRCYLDESSGHCAIEDLRLGLLPHGWTMKRHDRDHVIPWYVNEATGEGLDAQMGDNGFPDPRLTVDVLMERGVTLQAFNII